MASKYGLVLSDELQKEYYKFKNHQEYDKETIKKLLYYYKPPVLTNTSQIKRTGVEVDKVLQTKLKYAGYTTQTLEELARKTSYQVILSISRSDFPYININGDVLDNNLTGSFYKDQSRQKIVSHLTALCALANHVFIYDRYFSNGGVDNIKVLDRILPHKKLIIHYQNGHIEARDITQLESLCDKWIFKKEVCLTPLHDRYIVIDNEVEVILTSGFDYLSNTGKECTYIVRPFTNNHLLYK